MQAAADAGADAAQCQREMSDLELFVEFGAKQRAKHVSKEMGNGVSLLLPLKDMTGAVQRGVEEEMQTVRNGTSRHVTACHGM